MLRALLPSQNHASLAPGVGTAADGEDDDMKLIPPDIYGTLTVCSTTIEIEGNIAVEVWQAEDEAGTGNTKLSSHVSTTPDDIYPIGATLTKNHYVTVRQILSPGSSTEATSDYSTPVKVGSAPDQLSAMTVTTTFYEWGRMLWVDSGATSGAKVEASVANAPAGSATAVSGHAEVTYDPPLGVGAKLSLKQTACNGVHATQVSAPALALPALVAPTIKTPIFDCQTSLDISDVLSGAYVEIQVIEANGTHRPLLTWLFSVSFETNWLPALKEGETVKVRQGFKRKLGSPTLDEDLASPWASTVVQPLDQLPAPRFLSHPCPGSTYVTLDHLVPGARVVLLQGDVELGETDAPSSTYTFKQLPGLEAGKTLSAYQELCSPPRKGAVGKTTVGQGTQTPTTVRVSNLFPCAAYVYVAVDTPGSYLVYISKQGDQQISGVVTLIGDGVLVPVSPALVKGDALTVHVQDCGGTWKDYSGTASTPFKVLTSAPPEPAIHTPAADNGTERCLVDSGAAGAVLAVYVTDAGGNALQQGSAISLGNLASTEVSFSAPLDENQLLYCTQTMCGVTGKKIGPVKVVRLPPEAPRLLQPVDGATIPYDSITTFEWEDPGFSGQGKAFEFKLRVMDIQGQIIAGWNLPASSTQAVNSHPIQPTGPGLSRLWEVIAVNGGGEATSARREIHTSRPTPPPPPPVAHLTIGPATTPANSAEYAVTISNTGGAASGPYDVQWTLVQVPTTSATRPSTSPRWQPTRATSRPRSPSPAWRPGCTSPPSSWSTAWPRAIPWITSSSNQRAGSSNRHSTSKLSSTYGTGSGATGTERERGVRVPCGHCDRYADGSLPLAAGRFRFRFGGVVFCSSGDVVVGARRAWIVEVDQHAVATVRAHAAPLPPGARAGGLDEGDPEGDAADEDAPPVAGEGPFSLVRRAHGTRMLRRGRSSHNPRGAAATPCRGPRGRPSGSRSWIRSTTRRSRGRRSRRASAPARRSPGRGSSRAWPGRRR